MSARRRTRAEYERGLPGYHDPTAGIGGSTPGLSALTLRAVLAVFGLVVCAVGAVLAVRAGLGWFAVALGVVGAVALVDLVWILYRKHRGEPG
ncbi:DUF6343 family protein [Pseudonocardia hydrocarbonoxydans]|uniref:Uncharacterized protein n=1 Tax=Pseudonocardia hydrocarbonoxydans TaxID=76726 RepID=A0A4Y3WR94_9PSEU|nr:DUF6343 family protein [Pseudonocardia hydrocarbonoxydans]GEC21365.1 hypothetical protein PHY01_36480 [Pseudonocardia hydrocarbonoxydans]